MSDFNTRARDYIDILEATLPQMQFHAYADRERTGAPLGFYIFAFITSDVLIGGYSIDANDDDTMLAGRLISLAQFFRRAWEEEVPRFFPQDLQSHYETHRDHGTLWRRIV